MGELKKVIMDTDVGLGTPNKEIDDGLAISLALSTSKEVQVEVITTVFGNVTSDQAYKNAFDLLNVLGRSDIQVERGALKPLKDAKEAEPSAKAAARLMISKIMEDPNEFTLICLAPLTNLASAINTEPDLTKNVKEVYIMGGAINVPGMVTPSSEFNIYLDPFAAKTVFNSKMPMTLVPLDVTTKTLITHQHLRILESAGGEALHYICNWVERWLNYREQVLKLQGEHLHDPLATAIAIDNTLARMEQMFVDVETKGEITKGMTIAERRAFAKPRVKNMKVCVDIDEPRFMKTFIESLRSLAQK